MADNKLFYNVAEGNAESFKAAKKDEKVIGLIKPAANSASSFGYFISGGQQYGASYHDIELIAAAKADGAYTTAKEYADSTFAKAGEVSGKFAEVNNKFGDYALKSEITDNDTKPNGTGKFTADGVEYTISFDATGKISVNKYIAISNVKIALGSNAQSCFTASGALNATQYVGSSYNTTLSLTMNANSPRISAVVSFDNPSSQNFNYTISNAYFAEAVSGTGSDDSNIYAYLNADDIYSNPSTTSVNCSGTVAWNSTYTKTISATKTQNGDNFYKFTYTFKENTDGKTTTSHSGSVAIDLPQVTCKVASKSVAVLCNKSDLSNILYVQDVTPGAKVTFDKTITGIAGEKFVIAIQDGATFSAPKAKEAGSGFDVENYFSEAEKVTHSFTWAKGVHKGGVAGTCSSTFRIYESAVLKADDKIRIVLS